MQFAVVYALVYLLAIDPLELGLISEILAWFNPDDFRPVLEEYS